MNSNVYNVVIEDKRAQDEQFSALLFDIENTLAAVEDQLLSDDSIIEEVDSSNNLLPAVHARPLPPIPVSVMAYAPTAGSHFVLRRKGAPGRDEDRNVRHLDSGRVDRTCWRMGELFRYYNTHSLFAAKSLMVEWSKHYVPSLRSEFQQRFQVVRLTSSPIHPHAQAASLRSSVGEAFKSFIHSVGREPYMVGASARDKDERGLSLPYMVRDLALQTRVDPIRSTDVICFIDVDYYVDLNKYLVGNPVLLYTFVPTRAGGSVPDGWFSVDGDMVDYHADGGGHYRHGLWDFNTDYITVKTGSGLWLYSVDNYLVEGDDQRRVVALFPQSFTPWYTSWLLDLELKPLLRRVLTVDGVSVVRSHVDGKQLVSLSTVDGGSVTLPIELLEAIKVRHKVAKWKNISDVERYLMSEKVEKPAVYAALLFDILNKGVALPETVPLSDAGVLPIVADHYQSTVGLVTEDAVEYGRVILPPLVIEGGLFPGESYNNDLQCIKGRVEDAKNTKIPPFRYTVWARQYVKALVPVAHIGVPLDIDEVVRNQSRPTQLTRLQQGLPWLHHQSSDGSAFQKRESYGNKITDPRNISTMKPDHLLRLSRYTYAFKRDILQRLPFFMPGLTPPEIAAALQAFVAQLPAVDCTDLDRFDGTHSLWMRENIEFAAYLRWVAADGQRSHNYSEELSDLLHEEIGARYRTSNGVRYNPGPSRLSGSPLTTDGNTINNGFLKYAAGREEGLGHEESFRTIGPVYGDDGVGMRQAWSIQKAADCLGLSVKVERVHCGEPVPFLGRIFTNLWVSPNSVQDPMRTLNKIHLSTTSKDVPVPVAAVNRVRGYLVTDKHTPLVSHYCEAVMRVYGDIDTEPYDGLIYKDRPYFANTENSWPQEVGESSWMVVARSVGLSLSEVQQVCATLEAATTLSEFPAPCIEAKRRATIQAVVRGEVVQADTPAKVLGDKARPSYNNGTRKQAKATTMRSTNNRGGQRTRDGFQSNQEKKGATETIKSKRERGRTRRKPSPGRRS